MPDSRILFMDQAISALVGDLVSERRMALGQSQSCDSINPSDNTSGHHSGFQF